MAEKKKVKKKKKMSSAEKQAKQALVRRSRNQAVRKRLRSTLKRLRAKGTDAKSELPQAYSLIDRAAKKGVIHKRAAARRKSRLAHLLHSAPSA